MRSSPTKAPPVERADTGADTGSETGLTHVDRKDRGVYYTPDSLAELVVGLTLDPILERAERERDLRTLRVLDPAVGGGAFLIAATRAVRLRLRQIMPAASEHRLTAALATIVREGFFGLDVDPLAGRMTDLALRLECIGTTATGHEPFARVYAADALGAEGLAGERWDAILCNPPWGKIKPNVREYYAALDPRVRMRQGDDLRAYVAREHAARRADYDAYATQMLRRASALRARTTHSSLRHLDGRKTSGDADYYRFFLERILEWSSERTRCGLVIPIAFLNTEGASGLRRAYLERGTFEQLLSFENRERLFPIHAMYRFSIAIYRRGKALGIENAAARLSSVAAARKALRSEVRLNRKYLSTVSPFYGIIPIVGDIASRNLLERLRTAHPALASAGSRWGASFRRECDMTQHAARFVSATALRIDEHLPDSSVLSCKQRYLPVYEGRMVEQFDACAKIYVGGAGRRALWREREPHEKWLAPHYFMHENDVSELTGRCALGVRAAYCDISGHANERTLIAALVPSGAICGNKVPVVGFSSGAASVPKLWIAVANALVVDWVARRLVSTTVNFFYWHDIPMPFIDPDSDEGRIVVAAVRELHAWRPSLNPRGTVLRALIDAYVAHQFDLSMRDLRLILNDFPQAAASSDAGRLASIGLQALHDGTSLASLQPLLTAQPHRH